MKVKNKFGNIMKVFKEITQTLLKFLTIPKIKKKLLSNRYLLNLL